MATHLRTQYLLAFGLAAILPVAVLGVLEFSFFQKALPEREQQVLDDNLRLADLLAANLRYELNLVLDPVQKAADPGASLTRLATLSRDAALARLMSTTPLFRHLFLVDPRRQVVASAKSSLWTGQQLPPSVFPPSAHPVPVYYSTVFRSIYDGAPLAAVAVAYPTFARGALVSLLDLSVLESQMQSQSTANRRVYVVDQTGQVLADSQGTRVGESLANQPSVRAMLTTRRGTLRFQQTGEGENPGQLAAFTSIPGTGWGVVVSTIEREAFATPLANFQGFAVSLTFTALASVGFAYWLSDRISRPLKQLSERMQNLALGHPQIERGTPVAVVELQVLIDAFRAMSEQIRAETEANRRLLESLTAERDKLGRIIETIAEGVLVYDRSGQVTTANPALWSMLAVEPGAIERWQDLPLRGPLDEAVEVEQSVLARAILEGPATGLYRLPGPGGQPRVLQVSAAPLRTGDGQILGAVAVMRDITAQKQTERLREDFVATLTHDLRTPLLAAVQTLGFAIEEQYGPLNDAQQQVLLAVVDSHRELLALVESLLTIYRYEAGRIRLRKEPTDLAAFVAQILDELQPLARARNQTLVLTGSGVPALPCDRQQLKRVVVNLVDNALRYTPSGGRVRVCLEKTGPAVQVAVQDTGRGIPPEKLAGLFMRFAQVEGYGTGTGLGLYLCRQVIEAHGGNIWAVSEPGIGSTFYFSLPVADRS